MKELYKEFQDTRTSYEDWVFVKWSLEIMLAKEKNVVKRKKIRDDISAIDLEWKQKRMKTLKVQIEQKQEAHKAKQAQKKERKERVSSKIKSYL